MKYKRLVTQRGGPEMLLQIVEDDLRSSSAPAAGSARLCCNSAGWRA